MSSSSSSSSSSLQTEVPLETYTTAPTRLKVDLVSKTSLKRHDIFPPTHRPHLQRICSVINGRKLCGNGGLACSSSSLPHNTNNKCMFFSSHLLATTTTTTTKCNNKNKLFFSSHLLTTRTSATSGLLFCSWWSSK